MVLESGEPRVGRIETRARGTAQVLASWVGLSKGTATLTPASGWARMSPRAANRPARGRLGAVGIPPLPRERLVTIIARDPGLKVKNRIVRAQVLIPAETLAPGPVGYRVEVIDYDASND